LLKKYLNSGYRTALVLKIACLGWSTYYYHLSIKYKIKKSWKILKGV